ncbi:hypothetical protein [Frigidibacter sp. MR17.24]|uniref:hypothetical protein n=1 Tax=Frigidibacter sp. MR17.24 TaxID=3127345 RepID=UPI003012FDE5
MTAFRTLTLALAATALVAGCGTRLNPMTWFGGSRSEPVAAAEAAPVAAADGRALVHEVTALEIVRSGPSGALVTATGLAATQGYWNAALVPVPGGEPSVATYRFVVAPPQGRTAVSTPQSRELTAAAFLNAKALAGVRRIVVLGETNQRSANR